MSDDQSALEGCSAETAELLAEDGLRSPCRTNTPPSPIDSRSASRSHTPSPFSPTLKQHDFAELDDEISMYESSILSSKNTLSGHGEPAKSPQHALRRLISTIKGRIFDRPFSPPPASSNTSTVTVTEDASITCRLCENGVAASRISDHTEWCGRLQYCILKKAACQQHLLAVLQTLRSNDPLRAPLPRHKTKLLAFLAKALDINEEEGKAAVVGFAKLQYQLAKLELPAEEDSHFKLILKRAKYLVLTPAPRTHPKIEQKRVLAERFADLLPKKNDPFEYSGTESSLEISPKRPSTPISKLTTLFAAIMRGTRPATKSPLLGTSPPQSSLLRITANGPIPQISDFDIVKPISRGAYGNVYLALKRSTSDLYAIKALKKSDLIRKNMTSHVLTERRVLSLAQTPYVVMLYYAFESPLHLFLVMEYLIGGDLSSVLEQHGRVPEATAKFYAAEMVLALENLHAHGIIHRDIKPDNILLDAEGHLKLTDFGLANFRDRKSGDAQDRVLGTPDYLAPEILRGEEHGSAVDWWSLGVCLFEFLVGMPPFSDATPQKVFENILAFEGVDWPSFGDLGISAAAMNLVDRLLDVNPATRSAAQATMEHPFFAGIDWDCIRQEAAPIVPQPCDPLDTSCFEARNRRFNDMGLPEDFMDAEPVNQPGPDQGLPGSGVCTPTRASSISRRTMSPFDGFVYKNIDLLSKVNRKLSSTPTSLSYTMPESQASSAATISDSHAGLS